MNWTAPEIYIRATDAASAAKAKALAEVSGLALVDEWDGHCWQLLVSSDSLELVRPDNVSVSIDFINGKAMQRASESDFKKQPLARALGLQKLRSRNGNQTPAIIDATAGFGTDGWMMASLGCSVTLLEQSSVLCVLLQHAIDAAKLDGVKALTAGNLALVKANSVEYLHEDIGARVDVVYLDPMYPAARKQALVKKGMQLLHELIGPDDTGHALLAAALAKADYRVVVKRPKGAPRLDDAEQHSVHWQGQVTQVESPNTRFDVYHIGNA